MQHVVLLFDAVRLRRGGTQKALAFGIHPVATLAVRWWWIGNLLEWPSPPTAIAAAAVCFVMRFIAIRRGWSLPRATPDAD